MRLELANDRCVRLRERPWPNAVAALMLLGVVLFGGGTLLLGLRSGDRILAFASCFGWMLLVPAAFLFWRGRKVVEIDGDARFVVERWRSGAPTRLPFDAVREVRIVRARVGLRHPGYLHRVVIVFDDGRELRLDSDVVDRDGRSSAELAQRVGRVVGMEPVRWGAWE